MLSTCHIAFFFLFKFVKTLARTLFESSSQDNSSTVFHQIGLGARFSKSWSVSKNAEVYSPETSCMKGNSVHIKNIRMKQIWNSKVTDFALALRTRKFSGLSRNMPLETTFYICVDTGWKFSFRQHKKPINVLYSVFITYVCLLMYCSVSRCIECCMMFLQKTRFSSN